MGTLGRSIVDGDKTVTIFGERIQVEAEIHNFQGFPDMRIKMVFGMGGGFRKPPHEIFLVHGEEAPKDSWPNPFRDLFVISA